MAFACRGVALGDSWISPISYVQAWPGYLHALSLLDDAAEEHLATFAADTKVISVASACTSVCVLLRMGVNAAKDGSYRAVKRQTSSKVCCGSLHP